MKLGITEMRATRLLCGKLRKCILLCDMLRCSLLCSGRRAAAPNGAAFFVLSLLCVFAACAQTSMVAVNDFRGEGVAASSARIISDRIRSELVNSGLFRIIERSEMDNILKEQGFQQSGACDDQKCLIEVGQLLGVDRIIAGTVGRLGDLFTISMRMIDVGSGEIVATVNEDCRCSVEELVSKSAPAIVRKLALRLEAKGSAGGEAATAVATVSVSSEPQGARLSLDGKVVGTTPYENTSLAPGEYALRLERDGYKPREEAVVVDAKKPLRLSYALEQVSERSHAKGQKKGQVGRRILFGVGAAALAGAGVALNQYARSAHGDYSRLPAATSRDEFDAAWNDVERFKTLRNGAYILSAVSGVAFGISLFF
jgi:hypothetical protein